MKNIRNGVAFVLFFCHAGTFAQTLNTSAIDSLLASYNQTTPGATLAIVKNGTIVHTATAGLADLEHNIPITPATVFYIASMAKQFTAFCILLLEEQGKLALNDPIQKYLPDFPQYGRPITISHLVHHTSGLRDYSTLVDLQGRSYLEDIPEQEIYQLIKNQKQLNFLPGDEYTYSNSGYFLLARIIQVASGQPLKQFAQDNIFTTLGMFGTTYLDNNGMLIMNRAFSYEPDNRFGKFNNIVRRYALVGSGGVYASLEDLARWDNNLYHNKLGKGTQHLINRMLQVDTLTTGQLNHYAFGIEHKTYKGLNRISHGGSNAGFRTFFLRFPQDSLSIIFLANRKDADLNIPFKAADILLNTKIHNAPSAPAPPSTQTPEPEISLTTKQFAQLTGTYFSSELSTSYTIKLLNDKLYLSINNGPFTPLLPKSPTEFYSPTFGTLTFVKHHNKVKAFTLSIARITQLHFSKTM